MWPPSARCRRRPRSKYITHKITKCAAFHPLTRLPPLPHRLWDEFKQQKKDFDVYMDEERKVRDAQRKIRDEEYQKKLYVSVERPWI